MEENNSTLKIVLGVAAAAIIILALWRVLIYEPSKPAARPSGSQATSSAQAGSVLSEGAAPISAKWDELLPHSGTSAQESPRATSAEGRPSYANAGRTNTAAGGGNPGNLSARRGANRPAARENGKRFVDTNFYSQDKSASSGAQGATSSRSSGQTIGPSVAWNGNAQSRMQDERTSRMLPSFLKPNRKQQEQMNEKLANLSTAIERAVMRALTPKSKKEQMIEKYSAKGSETSALTPQEAAAAGEFAPVVNAIASQKQSIVNGFGNAFGSGAAKQASQLMDSFAGEVSSAVSDASASPEAKAQRVKEITKKYQDKMNKLEEKSQYDKFMQDRLAKANQQKEELGNLYPQDREQIARLVDEKFKKDNDLLNQNLSQEEYFTQLAKNEQEFDTAVKDLAAKSGSVVDYLKWQREQDDKTRKALGELEEAGQVISAPRKATQKEIDEGTADLEVKGNEILENVRKFYGDEVYQEYKDKLENYKAKMNQLYQTPLSPKERADKQKAYENELNRWMNGRQIELEEEKRKDLPEDQRRKEMEEYYRVGDLIPNN